MKPVEVVLWVLSTTVHFFHDRLRICSSVLEGQLVLTNFISEMNLQPVKAVLTERLTFGKLKQPSIDVGSHVIEVGRNGIHTATEVHVMREINLVNVLEAHGDRKSEKELTAQSM